QSSRRRGLGRDLERGEGGGRKEKKKAVAAHLRRQGQPHLREGRDDESHEARRSCEHSVRPAIKEPEKPRAEKRRRQAQKERRAPQPQPEAQKQKEERGMRVPPDSLINIGYPRQVGQLDVERLMGAQGTAPRLHELDGQSGGDDEHRREI